MAIMTKGKLVVYTGYSGVGKGTIMKRLLKADDSIRLSVSCTTRDPRPGEVAGVDYNYITKAEFEQLIAEDGFLEYAQYCDNYYGTPRRPVEEMLAQGYNVFLEIEVQGGMQVMQKVSDRITMFVVAPSFEELERRLRERGTEDEETIKKRLAAAREEEKFIKYYDNVIMNDTVDNAVEQVLSILHK